MRNIDDYISHGQFIQTTDIISILLCAPLGAILIDSMGPKLLTKDATEEEEEKAKGTRKKSILEKEENPEDEEAN